MLLEEASAALQENACASLGNLAINVENQVFFFFIFFFISHVNKS